MLRDWRDGFPFEPLMKPQGELVVVEHIGQERERELRRSRPAVSPFEAGRRVVVEIEPQIEWRASASTCAVPSLSRQP
jgi:hypothetical protein